MSTLELLLIARLVSLLIFSLSFFAAAIVLEMDRRKYDRGEIASAFRDVAIASGLFLLSTASLAISAIYRATANYQDTLVILLWISLGTFAGWFLSVGRAAFVLRRNGNR